jgi:hypothetical protein
MSSRQLEIVAFPSNLQERLLAIAGRIVPIDSLTVIVQQLDSYEFTHFGHRQGDHPEEPSN